MSHLTTEQRQMLERQLQELSARLRTEIADGLRASGMAEAIGLANRMENIDDEAVADLQASVELASVQRDVRELREAETALSRVGTAEFGLCTSCGQAIPFERLRANPTATRCLECQSQHERALGKDVRRSL